MRSIVHAMREKEEAEAEVVPPLPVLLARTAGELYRLAVRLTGDVDAADDVIQIAYLQAFEAVRAGQFRGECQLETWLYRIVTRVALGERRQTARRRVLLAERGDAALPAASGELLVELRELREALGALPNDQRVALVLKELQGLSGREVADVMERSEGAVEQLLVRARAALKTRFARG